MSMIIFPRISEKSYGLAGSNNVYVFNVPLNAGKIEIKKAVKQLYDVDVLEVNIVRNLGKPKETVKKRGRRETSKRSDYKKAYVKVKSGQTIPVFAAQEEDK